MGTPPAFGFIVDGVACGFLCRTDAEFYFIDNFATNPEAAPEVRAQGLALVIAALESEAVRQHATHLIAYTEHDDIAARCLEHGMIERPRMRHFTRKV